MERITGIYLITNKMTGEKYVGQSKNIYVRWQQHKQAAAKGEKGYPLYRSIRHWGIENFDFSILEVCNEASLNEREQYYMLFYNTVNFGFNQIYVGETIRQRNKRRMRGVKI